MNKVKFMWNGIKVDGKLHRAFYSDGNPGFITIYARDLLVGLPKLEGEKVLNGTDSQTDYYETDRIRISPQSKYYEKALEAFAAQQEHQNKMRERRETRRRVA